MLGRSRRKKQQQQKQAKKKKNGRGFVHFPGKLFLQVQRQECSPCSCVGSLHVAAPPGAPCPTARSCSTSTVEKHSLDPVLNNQGSICGVRVNAQGKAAINSDCIQYNIENWVFSYYPRSFSTSFLCWLLFYWAGPLLPSCQISFPLTWGYSPQNFLFNSRNRKPDRDFREALQAPWGDHTSPS